MNVFRNLLGAVVCFVTLVASATAGAQCRLEEGKDIKPTTCGGTFVGGLCSSAYFRDVTFERPFAEPPHVVVAARHISAQGGCVGGATDKWTCFPSNITTIGFRLHCAGSPAGASCGDYNGYSSYATADYLAVEKTDKLACRSESGHLVPTTKCSGTNVGGLCSGHYYSDITFAKEFTAPPQVLVAAENISNQGGCVGSSTDQINCFPRNITTKGFRMFCDGSPYASCGQYEGYSTVGAGGWIAKESAPTCSVIAQHGLLTSVCTGSIVNGTCTGQWVKDVVFPTPFNAPPKVIMNVELASAAPACAEGASDSYFCHPTNITPTGFRAICSGSPEGDECGAAAEGYRTQALFGYMAIPSDCSLPQCSDSSDNDGDGLTDTDDPGCTDPNDNNEGDGTSQCQDGVDNDNDGAVDFGPDFSCSSRQDNDETNPKAACQDGRDNDGDGLIDLIDPGCANNQDNNEGDKTSQCQDGIDNDNDGAIDFPADFSCESRQDNDEANPKSACQDGIDNDKDGLIDLVDPGCKNNQDNNEGDGTTQCQDGVDNDGDGAVDFPADFSCSSREDDDETNPKSACQDGADNDNDGLIDLVDPGCSDGQDNNEGDGTSQCQDGIDNDGDGATDAPADFSCSSPQDNDEGNPKSQCQDGLDNDGDGVTDLRDPGCKSPQDNDESDGTTQCQDGLDNDKDGLIDLNDPGCKDKTDDNEGDGTSQCQDGIDNDGDGAVDFPADFSCSDKTDKDESNPKAECQDGIDNDNDGLVDLGDKGCTDSQDNSETGGEVGPGCVNQVTSTEKEALDNIAIELAGLADKAANELVKAAKKAGATKTILKTIKVDGERAKKRAVAFLKLAKELLFKIPDVTQSCANLPPACVEADNAETKSALKLLYLQQQAAIKRFIARQRFKTTGKTVRDTEIVKQAKAAVVRGDANLATIADKTIRCSE